MAAFAGAIANLQLLRFLPAGDKAVRPVPQRRAGPPGLCLQCQLEPEGHLPVRGDQHRERPHLGRRQGQNVPPPPPRGTHIAPLSLCKTEFRY